MDSTEYTEMNTTRNTKMKSLLRYGLTVLTAVLLSISAVQVASAQCSIYTFNPISGQLDCVTTTGVNVITFATDGNERMRITQGGNVLVGTTTDDGVNLLQVDGSGAFATSVVTPLVTNAGTLGLSATGANVVTVSTNGVERGRFSAAGLFGVGTNNPQSTVHIVGSQFRWDSSATATDPGILFITTNPAFAVIQAGEVAAYNNGKALSLNGLYGGNLLVGTVTDDGTSKLQVAGNISGSTVISVGAIAASSGNGGNIRFRDDTGTVRWLSGISGSAAATNWVVYDLVNSQQPITIQPGTITNTLYLNSSGNALFGGATNGNYRLDVQSSGSSGTLRVYDQTAVTGSTSLVVRAGAGQSTNALQTWQNNAGASVAAVGTTYINFNQPVLNIGAGASTADVSIQIAPTRSGSGASYIDFIGDTVYTDYGFRIIRNGGENAVTELVHNGTSALSLVANTAGGSVLITSTSGDRFKANATGIGFFGVTPVARAAALTAADANTINTGDATSDTVIANMRTRIGELETKLQAYGLLQ